MSNQIVYGKTQRDIGRWLYSETGYKFEPDRSVLEGKEIDLLNFPLRLGIEYGGLFWHSDKQKKVGYHVGKFREAKKKHIRLVSLFEDEWLEKQDICKDALLRIINNEVTLDFPIGLSITEEKLLVDNCWLGFHDFGLTKIKDLPPKLIYSKGYRYWNCGYTVYSRIGGLSL